MKISNRAIFGTLAIVNGIQLIVLTIRNMKLSKEREKDNEYWARKRANRDAMVGEWYVKGEIDGNMFEEYVIKRDKVD